MSTHCPSTHLALAASSATQAAARARQQRWLILGLPICMLVSWMATLASGSGRLDGLGNPVGGDFAMFYVAGEMAMHGEWRDLYVEPQQQARLLQLMPKLSESTYLPYRYPPLVAMAAAPFALVPYECAFILFTLASISIWLVSIRQLVRQFIPNGDATTGTAIVAIAAAPVMLQTLIDGQASAWWFAIAAGGWCCLQRERTVAAGCLLALAACKPNVMLLLGVVLIVRYPRMLIGIFATGCLMLSATLLVAGIDCLTAYVDLGRQLALSPWQVETPYWKVQSLLTWSELLVGSVARRLNLAIGLCAALGTGWWWRRQAIDFGTSTQALCAGLLINALFNPYTPVYDLTLLCLGAFACVAALSGGAWAGTSSTWLERRDVQSSLAVILFGPILSQGFAKAFECELQLMPISLLAIAGYWCLYSQLRRLPLREKAGHQALKPCHITA